MRVVYHETHMTLDEQQMSEGTMRSLSVLLCNVRSAYNVGTIFRTADAAGVSEIILSGYTPTPIDRFGRKRKDVAKAALGAEETVPWRQVEDGEARLRELQKEGYAVLVLEQVSQAIPYTDYVVSGPTILVVGNEIEGVPNEICALANACIQIPMSGTKESLNVAVATGIALFRLRHP